MLLCRVFMAISLLALDLDGTLLNPRGQISERNRIAIENARAKGVRVALVTGRRFRDSRPIALELGLDVPLISHNGALTKHAETLANRCRAAVAARRRARSIASRTRRRRRRVVERRSRRFRRARLRSSQRRQHRRP